MPSTDLAATARKMQARKQKSGRAPAKTRAVRPTEERDAKNETQSAGMAVRVVPVIDTLLKRGDLTNQEYEGLNYYRDQASLADRSPMRSCIDFSPKGGGHGPGIAILSAQQETQRIERDMGQLASLCRAVCVYDISIAEWCAMNGQEIEWWELDTVPEDKQDKWLKKIRETKALGMPYVSPHAINIALLELKYASGGIIRA